MLNIPPTGLSKALSIRFPVVQAPIPPGPQAMQALQMFAETGGLPCLSAELLDAQECGKWKHSLHSQGLVCAVEYNWGWEIVGFPHIRCSREVDSDFILLKAEPQDLLPTGKACALIKEQPGRIILQTVYLAPKTALSLFLQGLAGIQMLAPGAKERQPIEKEPLAPFALRV